MKLAERRAARFHLGVVTALALACASCATRVHPAEASFEPVGDPRAAWGEVLEGFVDEEGRVDFEGLREQPESLERFAAWIGSSSPQSEPARFAGDGEALVYWIEAYTALAMLAVVREGSLPEDEGEFFYGNRFLVGGEWMALQRLREDHLLPMGDERALFAINDMSRDAPRLWREPLELRYIDLQLDARAREFLNSERNVLVRYDLGSVYLSRVLVWDGRWLLASGATFVEYVNQYRSSRLLPRTFVRWLDYDWSLNSQ